MHIRFLLVLVCLTGCSSQLPLTNVVVQPPAPVTVADPQPLTMNSVEWQVLTKEQLEKLLANAPPDFLLFALDTKNYNNLSLNLIDIERFISEQKATLNMLKNINHDRAKTVQGSH